MRWPLPLTVALVIDRPSLPRRTTGLNPTTSWPPIVSGIYLSVSSGDGCAGSDASRDQLRGEGVRDDLRGGRDPRRRGDVLPRGRLRLVEDADALVGGRHRGG